MRPNAKVGLGLMGLLAATVFAAEPLHPRLLLTPADVQLIRSELDPVSGFGQSLAATKARVDRYFESTPDVPVPVDPGGGYTHEKHKENGVAIHDAGILYQLTGDAGYAAHARDLLLAYADLYPALGRHPVKQSRTPGRLFWQSLNESVWLVYAIQGYDAIIDTLSREQRARIESGILRPLADFLSIESPEVFDQIHNHGTWAVAAVGMTGYVIGDHDYVRKALYGLKEDGQAGFIKQLDLLFSPDGYYAEGPYYQRYALMPFLLFARSIQTNDPEFGIFEYRDEVLLKAVYACVDLSYANLFFPVNDAIKDKGLDTVELRYGIAIAYALTSDPTLLSIAKIQKPYVLTGDGFHLARTVDAGLSKPYAYRSLVFRDGPAGDEGALVVLRNGDEPDQQAVVFKATSQGMGHGHFDKLNWLFYDNSREIVTDYGAARFLNVVLKNGGVYLPENTSWAKQTVAHNTLVVDERSHFDGDWNVGQQSHPRPLLFESDDDIQITAAEMRDAYSDVAFSRTIALLNGVVPDRAIVVDVLNVGSKNSHQYDLPLHFNGQIMVASPALADHGDVMRLLGTANGYQHLWSRASTFIDGKEMFSMTWLTTDRFYTLTTLAQDGLELILAELGANDPNFNLRREQALILRVKDVNAHTFVSVLEPHGEYNGPAELTTQSNSSITSLRRFHGGGADVIRITTDSGAEHFLALSYDPRADESHKVTVGDRTFVWQGYYGLFDEQGERK
jgi:hypothetical protein